MSQFDTELTFIDGRPTTGKRDIIERLIQDFSVSGGYTGFFSPYRRKVHEFNKYLEQVARRGQTIRDIQVYEEEAIKLPNFLYLSPLVLAKAFLVLENENFEEEFQDENLENYFAQIIAKKPGIKEEGKELIRQKSKVDLLRYVRFLGLVRQRKAEG